MQTKASTKIERKEKKGENGKTENGLSGSERNETKDRGKQRDFHNQEEAFEAQLYVRIVSFLFFLSSFHSRLRNEMNEKREQFVCSGEHLKMDGRDYYSG